MPSIFKLCSIRNKREWLAVFTCGFGWMVCWLQGGIGGACGGGSHFRGLAKLSQVQTWTGARKIGEGCYLGRFSNFFLLIFDLYFLENSSQISILTPIFRVGNPPIRSTTDNLQAFQTESWIESVNLSCTKKHGHTSWMSQEVSKWLVSGLYPQYTPFIRGL